jgi:RimJ/RimL family protein N-acetyltransferase
VALVDDVVVAFSFALTHNRDRYQSGMTGPRRACRGMGLARPVKLAALRRARHAGYRHAVTSNDADNEAMLAINRRLGYRVVGGEWQYRRELRR